ncbi:MAG: hypothetical protein ABTS16_01745 [Candidatus Accumulibacter phosphatis]|jgi:predicted RNase H-like nuclease (RuvC/YqgF family)|uniref:hypothetical protein n=1 Tax=Candidatus Accumulibacter contiguus TaxID=2954381 RepID=UPI002FC30658
MTNNQSIVKRKLEITRQSQERFDAYARELSTQIFNAQIMGDTARETMLEATLKKAKKDMEDMRQALKKALLRDDLVDELESGLKDKADAADKLLKDMEQLGATLDRIAEGARVLTGALRLVKSLI